MEKKLNLGEGRGNFIELVIMEKTGLHWESLEEVKGYVISLCGNVNIPYDGCWGQCQHIIKRLYEEGVLKKNKKKVLRVIEIWDEWHLSHLKAGTKKQTEYLKNIGVTEYKESVKKLKEVDLYIDNGFKYGYGWLFNPVPETIIKELEELFG